MFHRQIGAHLYARDINGMLVSMTTHSSVADYCDGLQIDGRDHILISLQGDV